MNTIVNIYKDGVLQSGITPVFGDDVIFSRQKENGQIFLRESLEGTWNFIGNGYTLLYNASTSNKFEIEVSVEKDSVTTLVGKGYFYKYDCEFNEFDKIAKVKATYTDNYTEILAKYDNEYDLVQLAPPTTAVNVTKRAVIQFYSPGDSKLVNIIGGSSYEVDCEQVASGELADYHFSRVIGRSYLRILESDIYEEASRTAAEKAFLASLTGTAVGELLATDVWADELTVGNYVFEFFEGNHYYHIKLSGSSDVIGFATGANFGAISQGEPVWIYYRPGSVGYGTHIATTAAEAFGDIKIYGRIIFDKEDVENAEDIPSTDITDSNLNYRYCREYPTSATNKAYIVLETAVSDTPTRWGKAYEDKYYDSPTPGSGSSGNYPIIPVGASLWGLASIWFIAPPRPRDLIIQYDSESVKHIGDYDEAVTIKDTYTLHDAIQTLLSKIDSSVVFSNTSTYSQFLYPDEDPESQERINPVSGEVVYDLLIAPISNVKKTYYTTPAQKGKISLKAILDMLKSCYQCYWFIEEYSSGEDTRASFNADFDDSFAKTNQTNTVKRLRIEHISYFKKGYTYSGSPVSIANLTTMSAPRNGQKWGYGLSHFSYDKSSLPNRYEFGWATSAADIFNGYPIKTEDAEVQSNSKQEQNASPFDADIDTVLAAPSVFSDDGFVVMEKGAGDRVPIEEIRYRGAPAGFPYYYAQNGRLAFAFLAQYYYLNSLGGMTSKLEGMAYTSGTSKGEDAPLSFPTGTNTRDLALLKVKKQDNVVFPLAPDKIHQFGTITTALGAGMLESLKWNIETGIATAELMFTPN